MINIGPHKSRSVYFARLAPLEDAARLELHLKGEQIEDLLRCGAAQTSSADVLITKLRYTNVVGDRRKAAVLPQHIESRIHFDRNQIERAVFRRLREPFEAQIEVAERELNPREFKRRDVPLLRVRLQLLKHFERLPAPTRQRERPTQCAMHSRCLR